MNNHELKKKMAISFCIILGIGMTMLLMITTAIAVIHGNGQIELHFNEYGEGAFEVVMMFVLSVLMSICGIENLKYLFKKNEDD